MAPEDQYQVILELLPELRTDPQALSWISLRAPGGKLVPLEALARVERSVGPLTVSHAGQLPAVNVSFNVKPGQAIGDSLTGLGLLLAVSIFVIYVVLGVLYESFAHPVTILTALPFAGFGALVTLAVFRSELSVYAFVGIVMLVGLVKKN